VTDSEVEPQAVFGDRSLFPALEHPIYLNHAAVSPISLPVERAIFRTARRFAARGVTAFPEAFASRVALRESLEALIGAREQSVALVDNTTRGVLSIALCLPWKAGDRVVLFEGEFPTNVTPWQRAASEFKLELLFAKTGDFDGDGPGLEWLEQELARGVRLVAVSTVQFQTGLHMPIERIGALCRRYGAELFVDAIQACGVVPIDVEREAIDYLACGGHKWLLGVEGTGFLYVRPALAPRLVPRVAGWLSHERATEFLFRGPGHLSIDRPLRQDAQLFEVGTLNSLGFAALEAAVTLVRSLGVEAIHRHVQSYHDALEPRLEALGLSSLRSKRAEGRSGILSFGLPDHDAGRRLPLRAPRNPRHVVDGLALQVPAVQGSARPPLE
jgi:selenocysteine lyase/cysteine desulfurase